MNVQYCPSLFEYVAFALIFQTFQILFHHFFPSYSNRGRIFMPVRDAALLDIEPALQLLDNSEMPNHA